MRAMYGHRERAITVTTTVRPGLIVLLRHPSAHATPRPIASSSTGNASITSIERVSSESTQPR